MGSEMCIRDSHRIEMLCCKNAGGDASVAKITAARSLGIPIWLLARSRAQKDVPNVEFHDNVDRMLEAIWELGSVH